jgi:hypothetical protein
MPLKTPCRREMMPAQLAARSKRQCVTGTMMGLQWDTAPGEASRMAFSTRASWYSDNPWHFPVWGSMRSSSEYIHLDTICPPGGLYCQ